MLIDQTHRKWAIATAGLTLVGLATYVPYHLLSPRGPQGGSAVGLAYAILGFGLMLFAGLLGLRKKFPALRIGRAQVWMRGHLWLGVLSYPLILFHAGFALGGTLTAVLLVLTTLVVVSGVLGAALQHYLPRLMTVQVPMETVYEEIPSIRKQLSEEADWLITSEEATEAAAAAAPVADVDPALPKTFRLAAMMDAQAKIDKQETVFMMRPAPKASESLRAFYDTEVKPFLEEPYSRQKALGVDAQARLRFEQMRTMVPAALHDAVNDLEHICEEARQLNQQERLHSWLHVWLLFHVPLSYAVLLLGAIHAVIALRY